MDAVQGRLLEDLMLLESLLGRELNARRSQIQNAYRQMKTYMERRVEYLRGALE